MRAISAEGLALLESGEFMQATLIRIQTSTNIFLTDHHRKITVGADTYMPIHGMSKIPDITNTTEDKRGSLTLELPNENRFFDSLIQSEGLIDKWVNIHRVIINLEDEAKAVFDLFTGKIIHPQTTDSSVKLALASYHTIFEKVSGIRTTKASHQTMLQGTSSLGTPLTTKDHTFDLAGTANNFTVKM